VASGHSPSGNYHIGTLREVMTANAITWALREAGHEAEHWDFIDDYDGLRKLPAGVPEEWREHFGRPLAVVPDPAGCHESYGAHYLAQLTAAFEGLGIKPDKTISGYTSYREGAYVGQIAQALDKLDQVRQAIVEVSGRALDDSWAPVQIADDNSYLRNRKFAGWDPAGQVVKWTDKQGNAGESKIDAGQVKLDWRLDWPARWAKYNVNIEPFGRDHATKGGSYDTGRVLVHRIFGGQAPYPVPYEFINKLGDTKKMSKSAGDALTPADALEVMPPEILRYFVAAARPSRTLNFDSGLGLYNLVDEFSKADGGEQPVTAVRYAKAAKQADMISRVPFNHLVSVYQAAREDAGEVRAILERTGYEHEVADEWPVIESELEFVRNWLAKYAPESVKFAVADELPQVELTAEQRKFLGKLAETVAAEAGLNAQGMHDAVYAAAEVAGLKPAAGFVALYRVLLGQDSGPKAGWFLASLHHDWLVQRLREGAA
jgi:lysyl-tRNA synthetase class 1